MKRKLKKTADSESPDSTSQSVTNATYVKDVTPRPTTTNTTYTAAVDTPVPANTTYTTSIHPHPTAHTTDTTSIHPRPTANTTYTASIHPRPTANTTYQISPNNTEQGDGTDYEMSDSQQTGAESTAADNQPPGAADIGSSLFVADGDSSQTAEYVRPGRVSYGSSQPDTTFGPADVKNRSTQSTQPSFTSSDFLKIHKSEFGKYEEENRNWSKILNKYKTQVSSAEDTLRSVRETEDPRRALHGPRRSRYLAPPTWAFSCKDIREEVDEMVRSTQRAVSKLVESKQKKNMLERRLVICRARKSMLEADTEGEWLAKATDLSSSQIALHTLHTGAAGSAGPDANMTVFEKSIRDIISTANQT